MSGGGRSGGVVWSGDGDIESSTELSRQLICVCEDGDLVRVKHLVEIQHGEPQRHSCTVGHNDATPLHIASHRGHLDIVRYLVEKQQCDVECTDKYGDTPLHYAAYGGSLGTIQYLISERGCDPICRGLYGRTTLHHACHRGKLNVVKYLVEDVKVEPSCRDEDDATPLHIASQFGQLSVVRLLVEKYQCDPATRKRNGETPTDLAQREGHTHITSYLSSIVPSELLTLACVCGAKGYCSWYMYMFQ